MRTDAVRERNVWAINLQCFANDFGMAMFYVLWQGNSLSNIHPHQPTHTQISLFAFIFNFNIQKIFPPSDSRAEFSPELPDDYRLIVVYVERFIVSRLCWMCANANILRFSLRCWWNSSSSSSSWSDESFAYITDERHTRVAGTFRRPE